MVDTQTTGTRSRKGEVLKLFEQRQESDKAPFGGVLEFYRFMQDQGHDS